MSIFFLLLKDFDNKKLIVLSEAECSFYVLGRTALKSNTGFAPAPETQYSRPD